MNESVTENTHHNCSSIVNAKLNYNIDISFTQNKLIQNYKNILDLQIKLDK